MIDYSIHACIEYHELRGLIYYLQNFLQDKDRILVTLDKNNTNDQMIEMVEESGITPALFPLNDFASMTKFIRSRCTNPTILELCADEVPTIPLIQQCRGVFEQNLQIDAVAIPRINIYSDLTADKAAKMYVGPRPQDFLINEKRNNFGWHVWPDYQVRLTKNVDYIGYGENVHSGHIGFRNVGHLPADPRFALLHVKSVRKQERMLKLYDRLEHV